MSTTINTKILLRYDELNNWSTSNPVLGTGEVGIAHYTSQGTNGDAQPHFFIKVGNGVTTWSALPFASGRAMDVYTWAKAPTPASAGLSENEYRLYNAPNTKSYILQTRPVGGTEGDWTQAGAEIDIAELVQDTNTQYQLAFSSAGGTAAIIDDKHKDLVDGANWTTDQRFTVEGAEGGINITRVEGTDGTATTVTVPIYYDLQNGITMEEAVSNASGAAETAQTTANAAASAAATAQSTADAAYALASAAKNEADTIKGAYVAGASTAGGEIDLHFYNNGVETTATIYNAATAATKAEVSAAIQGVTQFNYLVVSSLPATGTKGTIYLMKANPSDTDYSEYIWVEPQGQSGWWEKLGTIGNVKLTDYVKGTEIAGNYSGKIITNIAFDSTTGVTSVTSTDLTATLVATSAFPTGSPLAGATNVQAALNQANVAFQTAGDVAAMIDSITAEAIGTGKGVSSITFDTTTNKITLTKTAIGTVDVVGLDTTYATKAQAVTAVGATYAGNEGKVTYTVNGAVAGTVGSFLKYDTEYILNGGTAG